MPSLAEASQKYNSRTTQVTYEQYCGKQIRMGVPDSVCRVRYEDYIAEMRQGLGSRWAAGYTGQG